MSEQRQEVAAAGNGNDKAPVSIAVSTRGGLRPQTVEEMWKMAGLLAGSALCPKAYQGKPQDAFVAIQYGFELGIGAMQALQSIAVINGKPGIYGDIGLALIQGSGLLEDMEEDWEGDPKSDDFKAYCITNRRGRSKPVRREFSVAEAKTAGLWGKAGPWVQYPKDMLMWRARWRNWRANFADLLHGIGAAEELRDAIDITPGSNESPETRIKTLELAARLDESAGSVTEVESKVVEEQQMAETDLGTDDARTQRAEDVSADKPGTEEEPAKGGKSATQGRLLP